MKVNCCVKQLLTGKFTLTHSLLSASLFMKNRKLELNKKILKENTVEYIPGAQIKVKNMASTLCPILEIL